MTYHKVQFSGAYDCLGYQVLDSQGNQVALKFEDGTDIPTTREAYEVSFVEINAPTPAWG